KFTPPRSRPEPDRPLQTEDPEGHAIASVLAQESVNAQWSGALLSQPDRTIVVEGTSGFGDRFMVGERAPESLPRQVHTDVLRAYDHARSALGPVRFEWVHDGREVWIVQLHKGASLSEGRTIVPGDAARWHRFEVSRGIAAL